MQTSPASAALWAVTERGAKLAEQIAREMAGAQIYVNRQIASAPKGAVGFSRLSGAVSEAFHKHSAHIFIMATGIVVRMIAPHIRSKTSDPAVLVIDDSANFVISLVSGHLGGANALAAAVAQSIQATPVITTATDSAGVPAIDLLAEHHKLLIENVRAVKGVSMAFLSGARVYRHDPYGILDGELGNWTRPALPAGMKSGPGIYIDHHVADLPEEVLVLRPKTLVVGIGCNSGTPESELIETVSRIFAAFRLSLLSIRQFTTISDKLGEPGLFAMAQYMEIPINGYDRKQLAEAADVPNPSAMVYKHMGVDSVCEAAAILGTANGTLLVPKQKSGNVTVAVAAVS